MLTLVRKRLGFRVQGLESRVHKLMHTLVRKGFGFRVQGLEFRVHKLMHTLVRNDFLRAKASQIPIGDHL
jgi:hypothetical protein